MGCAKVTLYNVTYRRVKSLTKKLFKPLAYLFRLLKIQLYGVVSSKKIFETVYHENSWGDAESRSGPGSSLAQTEKLRNELASLITDLGVNSLLDIPCGDFNWLSNVDLDVNYVGADIVHELVERNTLRFGTNRRRFIQLDLLKDKLPETDIIFCRDVLVHLNSRQIFKAVKNIRQSNSRYLLTTTFPSVSRNVNIVTGEWRAIDLCKHPFNFPEPLRIIVENCTEANALASGKCLGLWKISDI